MEIPQFVEKALGFSQIEEADFSAIPSLNACTTPHQIKALNKKLVRFECMICDMYDEEYFI